MKWILALLLLLSAATYGQTDDSTKYIHYRAQYGQRMPRGWWDSVVHMPYGDTALFAKPTRPGSIMMHTDLKFYQWDGITWGPLAGTSPLATETQIKSMPYLAAWGNSLTAGYGAQVQNSYPIWLSRLSGFSVYNMGVSGETSSQILQRFKADTAKHRMGTIFWMGRNNFSDSNRVLKDIDTAVTLLGHDRYIILSIINGAYGSEDIGDVNYNRMMYVNDSLERKYGDHYKDVRAYLVSQYNPSIAQDVIDHGNDVPPSSLRADELHLNDSGYIKVAQFVAVNMDELQIAQDTAFPTSKITYVWNNPPPLGLNAPNIIRGTLIGAGRYPRQRFDTDSLGYYAINGTEVIGKRGTNLYMGSRGDSTTTAADDNIFIGREAGQDNKDNDGNIGIGYRALKFNRFGEGNIAIGHLVMSGGATGINNNVGIGYRTMLGNTGDDNVAVGSEALSSPSGDFNSVLGTGAMANTTTGNSNVAVGYWAGRGTTTAASNVFVGLRSGEGVTTGSGNTGVGFWSLRVIASATNSTAIGYEALRSATVGSMTAVGFQALRNTTSGDGNTAVGTLAGLENTTGRFNTYLGYSVGRQNNIGWANTAVGYGALNVGSLTNFSYNVAIGVNAGTAITGGAEKNILIGSYAGDNITTGSSNIFIGHKVRPLTVTTIGRMSIGNLIFGTALDSLTNISTGNVGIRTRNPEQALHIVGQLKVDTVTTGSSTDSLLVINNSVVKKIANAIPDSTTYSTNFRRDTAIANIRAEIAPKYSVYTATLAQTGTGNPTATVLGDNTIGSIVWTRNETGNYTGTLSSAFTANKTWLSAHSATLGKVTASLSRVDADTVTLIVYGEESGSVIPEDEFDNVSIEIRVYP